MRVSKPRKVLPRGFGLVEGAVNRRRTMRRRAQHEEATPAPPRREPVRTMRRTDPLRGLLWTGPRLDPFRDDGVLHVSDLVSRCIRKIALADRNSVPMAGKELWDSQDLTFRIGNALHDFITDKVVSRSDEVYGRWGCPCGDTVTTQPCTLKEIRRRDLRCGNCNKPLTKYHETQFYLPELNLIGNCDLVINFDGYLFLNEIKSINKKGFDDLNRPLADHMIQLLFYWYLARQLGIPVFDKVNFIYACKEWMIGSPYRTFMIDAREEVEGRGVLENYITEAQQLVAAKNGGDLPPRIQCREPNSPRAKKCELAAICFNTRG